MLYKVITFKDGTEQKCPEKYKDEQILEHSKKLGKEVESIRKTAIGKEEKENKTIAYEVRLSFNEDTQNVTISKEELPIVMWAFLKDSKVVCRNGAFRGKDIISVLPNFNAIMGWNKGYAPNPEDFALIQNSEDCKDARDYQNDIKFLCYESQTSQELLEKAKQLRLN